MKSIQRLISVLVAILTLSSLGIVTASATGSTCPIGYTGPDSSNVCVSNAEYKCTVSNDNKVDIDNQNAQGSLSGDANGDATQTGTATNKSGAKFNFTVTNGNECIAVQVVSPTKPGAGAGAPVTPPANITPTELANTGSDNTATVILAAMSATALAAFAVRAMLPYYKRSRL